MMSHAQSSAGTATPSRRRRAVLLAAGLGAVGVAGGAAYLVTQSNHPLANADFADIASALRTLEHLHAEPLYALSGWDLPHVLYHSAHSIDCSIDGYPQLKPAWFRGSVGRVAFATFSARGKMSHGLTAPVPGAPDIAQGQELGPAVDRVMQALLRFDRHAGALAPHFTFGTLSKAEYRRAHLMHLANHWDVVDSL